MSWSSRFGWPASTGRWSPFGGRPSHPGSSTSPSTSSGPVLVTDADYTYINPDTDNLDSPLHGDPSSSSSGPAPTSSTNSTTTTTSNSATATSGAHPRPSRSTDVLSIRHKSTRHALHFPAYSISDGALRVGSLRDAAARRLDVPDPRRVRMFFKGRNLKDDNARCYDEGLRSDVDAEILCVVGEAGGGGGGSRGGVSGTSSAGATQNGDSGSESDGDGDLDGDGNDDGGDGEMPSPSGGPSPSSRRKRNRSRKKKSRKPGAGASGTTSGSTPTTSGTSTPTPLPMPEHFHHHPTPTPAPASSSSSSAPSTTTSSAPQTPLQKIAQLSTTFHTTLLPLCESFISSPPPEAAKRAFEHKRLSETVLAQVLLKLDAVETAGDEEARRRRKELVREVQGVLGGLDGVVGGG